MQKAITEVFDKRGVTMKIKVDYVTNSSSEVFGVVLADSGIVGGLLAGLLALFSGCKVVSEDAAVTQPQTDSAIEDAASMAQQIAAGVLEDAKRQDEIVKDAYTEANDTLDAAQAALNRELDECKKNLGRV